MSLLSALFLAFGLGFLYFISAIPASVAAGAPLAAASIVAWAGYFMGPLVVLLLGAPLRSWLAKKWNLSFEPDERILFWRIWNRYGIIGLGLIAPITIGPQVSALILLALGVRPLKILLSIGIGAIPSTIGLAVIANVGTKFLHTFFRL